MSTESVLLEFQKPISSPDMSLEWKCHYAPDDLF